MKKLVLLIGLGFFFNLGQAQFLDSADLEDLYSQNGDNDLGVSFPNKIIREGNEFYRVRDSIHLLGLKYRFIEFDSNNNASNTFIISDGYGFERISIGKWEEEQFSLVDNEGRIIQMIYLDPEL